MRRFVFTLFCMELLAQTVVLTKPDGTSASYSPVAHPRILLDGPTGPLTLAIKDPDGTGTLKNSRFCSDSSQNCALSAETVWARSARDYLNDSCNGDFDWTGTCAATAALLYWMDNSGSIAGSGVDTGKRFIDYVLEAIRDIDNRYALKGVIDRTQDWGNTTVPPGIHSDYLGNQGWGWAFAYSIARTYQTQVYTQAPLSSSDITFFANAMLTGGSYDLETPGTLCQSRLQSLNGAVVLTAGSLILTGVGTSFTTDLAPNSLLLLKSSSKAVVTCPTSDPYGLNNNCLSGNVAGIFVRVASIQSNTQATIHPPGAYKGEEYYSVASTGVKTSYAGTWDRIWKIPARNPSQCGFLYNAINHNTVPATLSYRHTAKINPSITSTDTTVTTTTWSELTNAKDRMSESPLPPPRSACPDRVPFFFWLPQGSATEVELVKVVAISGTCPNLTLTVVRGEMGTLPVPAVANTTITVKYTNDSSWSGWHNQLGTRVDGLASLSLALMEDDGRAISLFEKSVNYYIQHGVNPGFRKFNTLWGPAWNDYGRSRTERFLARILVQLKNGLSPSLDFGGDWFKRLYALSYIYDTTPWNDKDHARMGNQGGACMAMANPSCWSGLAWLWGFAPGSLEANYGLWHLLNKGAFTVGDLDSVTGVDLVLAMLLFVPPEATGTDYRAAISPSIVANESADSSSTRRYSMAIGRSGWTPNSAIVVQYGVSQLSDKLWASGFPGASIDIGKGDWLLRNQKLASSYGYTAPLFNRFILGKQVTTPGGVTLPGAQFREPTNIGLDQWTPSPMPTGTFDRSKNASAYWYTRSPFKTGFNYDFHGFDSTENTWALRSTIHFRLGADDDWVIVLDDVKATIAQKMEQHWHYTQNNGGTYSFRPEGVTSINPDGQGVTSRTASSNYYLHTRWPSGVTYVSDLGVEVTALGSTSAPTTVAVGRDCTSTAPCRAVIGGTVYSWTGSGTVSATIPASSDLYVWITSAGAVQASAIGGGATCTGIVTCVSWSGSIPVGAVRILAFFRSSTGSAMAPCTSVQTSSWGVTPDQCGGTTIESNTGAIEEGSRHLFLRAGDSVTESQILTTHQVSVSAAADSIASFATSNWIGVQKSGALPAVAFLSKGAVAREGSDQFTTTHTGTAQYVIAGLKPAVYNVVRDGQVFQSNVTVATGEGVIGWSGSSGTWQVLSVASLPLNILTTTLPNGQVSSAYNHALTAEGGTGSYTWSLASGSLPAGLTLSPSGVISGTPSAPGVAGFTVQISDSSSTDTQSLAIIVAPSSPPVITTTTLPNGMAGSSYSTTLSASGGVLPFQWALQSGQLPPGLSLSVAGAISGVPTTPGAYSFTVQVQDSFNQIASQALSLPVSPPSTGLSITAVSLPDGIIGTNYSQTIQATGGTTPYAWAINMGSLCTGLSLNSSTGALSGTVAVPQHCTFTVQVTDSATPPQTATREFSVSFVASSTTLTAQVTPFQTGALVTYGVPGLLSDQPCQFELYNTAGDLVSTYQASSGPSRRMLILTGELATEYRLNGACGSNALPAELAFSTLEPTAAVTGLIVSVRPPSALNVDNVLIDHGPTESLGSSQAVACSAGCTFTLPGVQRKSLYYVRKTFRSVSNQPLVTSSIQPVLVP